MHINGLERRKHRIQNRNTRMVVTQGVTHKKAGHAAGRNLTIRGGIFYARLYEDGRERRVSLRTADREIAEARVTTLKRKSDMERFGQIVAAADDVVYFIHDRSLGALKVGISRKLESRFRSLKANTASEVTLMGFVPGSPELEKVLHRFLAPFHIRREWFRADEPVVAFVRALIGLHAAG